MAYGQKYLFRFESRAGRDVSIKVYKDGYSGAVIQRPIGQAPVLKKEKSGPVCGTSLSFYPECQVDQEFSEFYTSDPLEYRVDLYSGSALVWRGFITPELYSEPDVAPPYDVEVVATDGLGELKLHDYVGQGLVSIRAQLTYLLALTGISADVDFAGELNVTAQSVVIAANLLSNVKVSLDYMAGESCYDVLTLLLNTLHAEITTYGGRWLVSRETDITVTNGKVEHYTAAGTRSYYDNSVKSEGRMGVADLWPVGRMTTKIEPSKSQVTIQGPWHLANPLVNPGMTSDTGWTTPGGTTYDATKHAYKFSNEAVGSGSRLYQDVALSSMRQALTLSLKFVGYDSIPYAQLTATYTTGGAAYRIVQSSDGTLSWSTSGAAYSASASANAADGDLSNAQELSLEIPAFRLNGSFPSGTLRFIISAHSVYACGASLEIVLPVGWQDTITVNNGARGAGDTVEVLFGRESSDIIPYKGFLQGIALAANNSNVCTSWSDSRWSNLDFLALTSRGYALSIAAPRLRSTGTVNVPVGLTAAPLVITQGQVRFWLTEWTWNLLEDELEVDALSLPSAVLSVSTEEVTVMDSTAESSGGSSSGGGSAPSYSLPVASATTLGGIKVGTNLSIDANGVLSATAIGKNLIHESADCNTMEGNSLTVLDQDAGSTICSNKPADAFIDGGYGVLTVSHGSYKNQLFFPYGAGADQLYLRSSYFSGGVVWRGWNKIWHSGNCNNTSTPWSASSLNLGTGGLTFTETGAAYLDKWGNVHMVATSGAWSVNVPSIGEALHVDVNGNVGIGTSSPQEKLDVSGGNIRVTGASTDTRSYELTNGVYLWQLSHRGSNNSNRMGIYNCSGGTWSSELLTISTNGNVGIGTTSPSAKLHVASNAIVGTDVDGGVLALKGKVNVSYTYFIRNDEDCGYGMKFKSDAPSASPIVFDMNGNVGLGVIYPTYKLDVNGSAQASSIVFANSASSGPNYSLNFRIGKFDEANGGLKMQFGSASSTSCSIQVIDAGWTICLFKIDNSGNVMASGNISAGSDERWKHDIAPVDNGMDIIKSLRPSTWTWNEDHGGKWGAGLIAQDVQKVLPDAVTTGSDGFMTLNYNVFHAFEISALQNHETEIDRLRKRVKELETQLKQLKA